MTKSRPKPASNTDRAVQQLRELIFTGALPAGSDHLEAELAQRLEMSRTPVREAVRTLDGQGLVHMRRRKGVRIAAITPEDMADIYDILTELESLSAERAAERHYDAAALAALARSIDDMDRALAAGDLGAWAGADDRFHTELVRLGGNARVQGIAMMMSDQVRRARTMTLRMRPKPTQSNEDHARVYRAIANGDAATARAEHCAHRQQAKEMLVALLHAHRLKFV